MALLIEIRKNCRGKYDLREGDIDGAINFSNLSKREILEHLDQCMDNINQE